MTTISPKRGAVASVAGTHLLIILSAMKILVILSVCPCINLILQTKITKQLDRKWFYECLTAQY
jgi:hypothetical protein